MPSPTTVTTIRGAYLREVVEGAKSAGVEYIPLSPAGQKVEVVPWMISPSSAQAFQGSAPADTPRIAPASLRYLIDVRGFLRVMKASEWDAVTVELDRDADGETVVSVDGRIVMRTEADREPRIHGSPYLWNNIRAERDVARGDCHVDEWRGAMNKAWKSPRYSRKFPFGPDSEPAVRVELTVDTAVCVDGVSLSPVAGSGVAGVWLPLKRLKGLRLMRGEKLVVMTPYEQGEGDAYPVRLSTSKRTPDGEVALSYIIAPCGNSEVSEVSG